VRASTCTSRPAPEVSTSARSLVDCGDGRRQATPLGNGPFTFLVRNGSMGTRYRLQVLA